MFVTTEKQLEDLCANLRGAHRIAVDVEFMREKTYFPILAVVQVASENICAAIDALEVTALQPLFEILHDGSVEKVFHSGSQDLEIFFQESGSSVRNIFDTQMAASLVGFGTQVSLIKLVEESIGVRLDKSETYTNWTRRPLSEEQITYALNDVRYLLPVQDLLLKKLRKLGRDKWLEDGFKRLEDPSLYELSEPENQYLKIKGSRSLQARALAVLRELAAWRVREARKRDRFLNAIVREESLLMIAKKSPENLEELKQIRGMNAGEIKLSGPAILEAVQRGLAIPESQCPVPPSSKNNGVPNNVEGLLWIYAQSQGKKHKISPLYLASRKEISELAGLHKDGSPNDHPLLKGWKKKLVGDDLLSILDGKASLGIDPRTRTLKLIRKT